MEVIDLFLTEPDENCGGGCCDYLLLLSGQLDSPVVLNSFCVPEYDTPYDILLPQVSMITFSSDSTVTDKGFLLRVSPLDILGTFNITFYIF